MRRKQCSSCGSWGWWSSKQAVRFSDQPSPSPLRFRLFTFVGRKITQLIHGKQRNAEGHLKTRRHLLTEEVEWRLGQTYLGLVGLLAIPLGLAYTEVFRYDVGYHSYGRHYLGHWSEMPWDLKIVIPLVFLGHIVGMASAVRYMIVAGDFIPIDGGE
jgi:hypothetical protein